MSEQIKVTINQQEFEVEKGARLIDVCREKNFAIPSFCYYKDLELQASFLAAATTIVVKSIAPTGFYLNKHIMFRLTNGTRYFREITNASGPSGGNDTLTIAALGVNVAPTDIAMLSFITLVRLDSDVVEIDHSYELCSVVSIPVMEVPA